MTFREAAKLVRRMEKRIPEELRKAHADTLVIGYRLAIKHSSGTFKARGEYARAAASPHSDPGTINIQSGAFVRAWRVETSGKFTVTSFGSWGGATLTGSIVNDGYAAQFMGGTRFMVERPILEKVWAELEPIYKRNMEAALRRAISIK